MPLAAFCINQQTNKRPSKQVKDLLYPSIRFRVKSSGVITGVALTKSPAFVTLVPVIVLWFAFGEYLALLL